ncbi:MAG: YkgJ family cysteine cluster protein [bacterium]
MLLSDESGEVKVFTLSIETPDGQLPPARVQVPNIPLRLTNLIPPLQQLCNGLVELAIRREMQKGAKVSCQKGCGICCCQLVPLSPPEAFFFADYMRSLPLERREELERRFCLIREAMRDKGLMGRLEKIEDTGEHKTLGEKYFQMGLPCPFLEDNSCSIHPIRPFSCREYNVISPPELCRDPLNNEVKTVWIPRSMLVAMARLAAELYQVPLMTIPLTLSLDWAKQHEAFSKLTWPGIWLFEKMMEVATGDKLEDSKWSAPSSLRN